jgi:Domain of unknown function (DUF4105)
MRSSNRNGKNRSPLLPITREEPACESTLVDFPLGFAGGREKGVSLSWMAPYRYRLGLLVVTAVLFGHPTTVATAQPPDVRIELYTMGPGDYLFSKFGHAALCVFDTMGGDGPCYNYGSADFSTPGPLTWAVLRGRAEFWVSVAPLDEMLSIYRAEDRTIYRQVLPLSPERAAEMTQALATNALPENRRYRYDHFLDNCSTRPRDHINRATDGALRGVPRSSGASTFRELIRQNLENEPFFFLATDMFLGRPMDRSRSEYEAMFLPRVLRNAVESGLQVAPEVVYARRTTIPARPSPIVAHRLALALGVGIAGCLGIVLSSSRASSGLQGLFACVFGTLGLATWVLAILSPLPELRHNENLLVFLPTDFLLLLGSKDIIRAYSGGRLAGLLLVGLFHFLSVFIQPFGAFLLLTLPVLAGIRARAMAPFGSSD